MSAPVYKLIVENNAHKAMEEVGQLAKEGFRFAGMSSHSATSAGQPGQTEDRFCIMMVREDQADAPRNS